MDNSHVALVSVKLREEGFLAYRCDRPMPLGVNLNSLTKVLKCAKDDDMVTLKASDDADILNLVYEGKNSDRIAEYDMKLMDIDADNLGIPDTEYDARVTMLAPEFSRIVRDLSQLGETVRIEVSKEGVRFAAEGELANGSVLLKQTDSARKRYADTDKKPKKEKEAEDDEEEDEDQEEGSSKKKKSNGSVKKEQDGDTEMEDAEEVKDEDGEDEKPEFDSDEEEENTRKRKKAQKARVCYLFFSVIRVH
jgi:proliferating cell nuclear antigen